MLSGIFMGYVQQAGGGWTGDLWVADWDQIENANHFSDIHMLRFKSKEVIAVKYRDRFRFPLAEGVLSQPEPLDQTWLSRIRRRTRPNITDVQDQEAAEDEKADEENADEPCDDKPEDVQDAGGDRHFADPQQTQQAAVWDYWRLTADLLIRVHRVPRQKLFVPSDDPDLPHGEQCPIPTK